MNSIKTLIFPPPALPDSGCMPLTLGEAVVALAIVLVAFLAACAITVGLVR